MKLLSIAPLFLVLAVAGPDQCSQNLAPTTKQALCNVLVGPIRYNTYNKTSGRYSGPVLALDLKQRNQIGQRLGCPLYRASAGATQ